MSTASRAEPPPRPTPGDTAPGIWSRLGAALSGRRSWVVLLLGLIVTGAVMASAGAGATASPTSLPADAESARVQQVLDGFPDTGQAPAIAVVSRTDGTRLTPRDLAAVRSARERMVAVDRGVAQAAPTRTPGPPSVLPSDDGVIAIATVPVSTQRSGFELTDTVDRLRAEGRRGLPADLRLQVTGGPAFGADIAASFKGADVRLLAVTAGVVALLLLLTYRSPVLWLVPLLVVALADRVAAVVAEKAATAAGFVPDGSTSGIVSVLVFGAGTNYALLLVSRYREELRRTTDHRAALREAVRHAGPAILASNVTVVLALLALLLAVSPGNRVLGLSAAVGLLVALVFVLGLLPPLLALFGRRLFWPFVPRVGDDDRAHESAWHRVADAVVRRPVRVLAVVVPLLAILACGLLGTRVGLAQTEQFRVTADSADGYATLAAHVPAGTANPTTVVARTDAAPAVTAALRDVDGVDRATPTGASGDGWSRWSVVLDAAPSSDRAFAVLRDVRSAVHAVPGGQALVGGLDAQALDASDAADHDLRLVVPVVLAIVLLVLVVLLRAVVAPLLLITATILSALAAIGAGAWASTHLAGFPALDRSAPLFAFIFLVALGVDYTIFLVTRVREEAPTLGTRRATVRAVAVTGGVITSAGIVLAAVFVVLGILPLVTLTQLGIIVGLGILLDTFVVRTLVVPAAISLVGDTAWWPGRAGLHDHDPR